MPQLNRVLITGAAGRIGSTLRTGLAGIYPVLRLTDVRPLGELAAGEEHMTADLRDRDQCQRLLEGVDAAVHLAALPDESTFDEILQHNFITTYNVFEAARRAGTRRIVFASSIHAVGFHPTDPTPDLEVPYRPDSHYGLSKVYGESLGRLWWDKYGIEVGCMRIGSFQPKPLNRRHLRTWLSPDDTVRLVRALLEHERIGWVAVYGVSANPRPFGDNRQVEWLGYRPQDSSEPYRAEIEASTPPLDPDNPTHTRLGGPFVDPAYAGGI